MSDPAETLYSYSLDGSHLLSRELAGFEIQQAEGLS